MTASHRWPSSVRLYLSSFLIVGMSLSMLGPALTELRDKSGADIGGIGVLFMGQSLGYIAGSFAGGRLFDRFDGHRIYAAGLAVLAVGLFLAPTFDARPGLFAAFVVMGLGGSVVDLGANTMLIWALQSSGHRAMNLLHMLFGVGAVLAPLLVYIGLAVAARAGAVFCLVMAVAALRIPAPARPLVVREEHTDATVPTLALIGLFFTLYVGLELGFGGWIKTYGEEIDLSELAATWLTTAFWLSFTVGRAIASGVAHRVPPLAMLWTSTALTLVAASLLIVGDGAVAVVWVGTMLMGLVTGPQFAAMLNLVAQRIHVTGSATRWFIGGAGLGGLIFPWLIGRWLDARGATALPWAILLFGSLTMLAFVAATRALGSRRFALV